MHLLDLPRDLQGELLRKLSIKALQSLMVSCRSYRDLVRETLWDIGPEEERISPLFVASLPHLVSCECPIPVQTEEEILALALHPSLQVISLRLDLLEEIALRAISYFLEIYIKNHVPREGTCVNFYHSKFKIVWRPGTFYEEVSLGQCSWSGHDIVKDILPLQRYCSPYFPPSYLDHSRLEALGIQLCLSSEYIGIGLQLEDYLSIPTIASLLKSCSNLKHFGIYLVEGDYYIQQAFTKVTLIQELHRRGWCFPNITRLDYPVPIQEIPLLHQVFPGVHSPLLAPFNLEEQENLLVAEKFYASFQLLPEIKYPHVFSIPTSRSKYNFLEVL
jgi:hypothetical protein